MSNKIKRELENIEIPNELDERARLGVKQAKVEMNQDRNFFKSKVIYVCGAIVVAFFLLIGSTFVSPTMSEILAKVPLLNKIIQSESIVKVINDELHAQGYEVQGVSDSAYPDKIIYVSINGTEAYYDEVKDEVKEKTEEILVSNNYDAFTVEIEKYEAPEDWDANLDEQTKKFMKESDIIMNAISEKLKAEGFDQLSYGVRHNQLEHFIEIDVPDTETRTDELKQAVEDVVEQHEFGEFEVKLNVFNKERRDIEMAISSKVIDPLHEALRAKKEFHTKGMASSFHPAPLQIIVKTTVSSTDKDADEIANKLETAVEEFLATDEIKQVMKDEPYKVIIRSSDQKQIN